MTKEEFDKLLVEELPKLKMFALRMTRDSDTARDLVNSAVERMLKSKAMFEEGTNFSAWAYVILRNAFLDERRSYKRHHTNKREPEKILDSWSYAGQFEDLRGHADVMTMRAAFLSLSPKRRSILMQAGLGVTIEEMARLQGVTEGTVKSRVSRARDILVGLAGGGL